MLELGKAGTLGMPKGVLPVLRDGEVVATLRSSQWKEAATATIGDRAWALTTKRRDLMARWESEPADAVRLRAHQTSYWSGTWEVDLEGTPVEVRTASRWKGTRRYLVAGRSVAESGTTGGWAPRPTLDADAALPLEHQVFLLWVESVVSGRNSAALTAAVVAGGGAAVAGGS
ncbi:hypothetical protein [Blastococcus sp. SYSU DS0619]